MLFTRNHLSTTHHKQRITTFPLIDADADMDVKAVVARVGVQWRYRTRLTIAR